jgi:hypothetical protein
MNKGKGILKQRVWAFLQVVILNVLFTGVVHAQEELTGTADTTCVQKELGDLIRNVLDKAPKGLDTTSVGSVLLIPIIGSNPATGFMFGVGGQYAFKLGKADTKYSLLSGSAQFTTKKQTLFLLKNNVFTKNNNIYFSGDWRFLIFSQSTYGLGTNAPEGGVLDYQYNLGGLETSDDSLTQPLNFNFLRFYQSVSFRIGKAFYLGVGYNLDSYFKIEDEKLRLNPGDSLITSHYAYNKYYGYETDSFSCLMEKLSSTICKESTPPDVVLVPGRLHSWR